MSSGEIRDFSKPAPKPADVPVDVERRSAITGVEPVSVHLHEKIIREEDGLRSVVRKPSDVEIRLRDGISQQEWQDKIKREDEQGGSSISSASVGTRSTRRTWRISDGGEKSAQITKGF